MLAVSLSGRVVISWLAMMCPAPTSVFDSEENEALLVFPDHTESFAKASKYELAMHLIKLAEEGAAGLAEDRG